MNLYLRATVGVERDLPLLGHFIDYYRSIGVERFRLVLHARDRESDGLKRAVTMLEERHIEDYLVWVTSSWNTGANAEKHKEVITNIPEDAWVITADIDEFHDFPKSLPDFLKELESKGVEVVKGRLTERVRSDFRLVPLVESTDIFSQFPVETSFGLGNPGKIILHRRYIVTTSGHHSYHPKPDSQVIEYQNILKVMHFKWFGDVGRKYVDPSVMAHHSSVWEFQAYDQYIKNNFYGVGRVWNSVIHQQWFPEQLRKLLIRIIWKIRLMRKIVPKTESGSCQ